MGSRVAKEVFIIFLEFFPISICCFLANINVTSTVIVLIYIKYKQTAKTYKTSHTEENDGL